MLEQFLQKYKTPIKFRYTINHENIEIEARNVQNRCHGSSLRSLDTIVPNPDAEVNGPADSSHLVVDNLLLLNTWTILSTEHEYLLDKFSLVVLTLWFRKEINV